MGTTTTTTPVTETPSCPPGYTFHVGDVPTCGTISTDSSITDIASCAAKCDDDSTCCSFEYSLTATDCNCNLNRECNPTTAEALVGPGDYPAVQLTNTYTLPVSGQVIFLDGCLPRNAYSVPNQQTTTVYRRNCLVSGITGTDSNGTECSHFAKSFGTSDSKFEIKGSGSGCTIIDLEA